MRAKRWDVSDGLWERVEPLLPVRQRRFRYPGRKPLDDSKTGPSPVDRGRAGSKHQLLVDGSGLPLAWTLTGGNRNDTTQLIELVDLVPPVRGRGGRPRQRPDMLLADRGYDHDK